MIILQARPPLSGSGRMIAWVRPSPDLEKVGVLAEFSAEGDGKPTVMRYIIRDQAGMTDYWEDE